MSKFITQENLLDIVHSMGKGFKWKCHPSAHPYDDEARTVPYKRMYQAARIAWLEIKNGVNPITVIEDLRDQCVGVEANGCDRLLQALKGDYEVTSEFFTQPKKGFTRVTYNGDYYHINSGDRLNRPIVQRVANQHLPEEQVNLQGSLEIAGMMPNPCTRIQTTVQAL